MKKINIASILFWLVYFGMLIMLMIGCLSCNTAKQATKHYNKAKDKNIVTVATLARKDWPCITTKKDTTITYRQGKTDTLIESRVVYADCPDTARNAPKNSIIKVPVNVPYKVYIKNTDTVYRDITKSVEDSSKIFTANQRTAEAEKRADKVEAGRNTWRVVSLLFIGLFVLAMILIVKKVTR